MARRGRPILRPPRENPRSRSFMQKPVRKAVFPVAGLGTRFLPATKAMPKEMLTVVDKPLIQYAVEEAKAAGIEQFYFVTGRGKSAIEDHFDLAFELEATLRERGKQRAARRTARLAAGRRRDRLYPPAAPARARPRRLVRAPPGRRRAVRRPAGRRSDGRRAALPQADGRRLSGDRRQHRRGDRGAARADPPLRRARCRRR